MNKLFFGLGFQDMRFEKIEGIWIGIFGGVNHPKGYKQRFYILRGKITTLNNSTVLTTLKPISAMHH